MKRLSILVVLTLAGAAHADVLVFTHAKIHTVGAAGTLEDATLIVRNELIDGVGINLSVPEGAKVIDAKGRVITPGLFDAYTQLGLDEISGVAETRDDSTANPRYSAALDVLDGLNPRSVLIPVNRIEGITQAMTAPITGDGGPLIAGRGAIINLGTLADSAFVAKPRAAMFAQLGESAMGLVKGGRPAVMLAMREGFEEVKHAGTSSTVQRDSLLGALDIEALKPVLAGDMPLVVHVERAADIRAALKLADEYGIKLIIHGGAEAYLLAQELAEKKVPVILDPELNLPTHFETLAHRADAAATLQKAGVLIAFASEQESVGTHNSRNIRQLAGNSVAYGMPWNAALAAVTINPAKIYGLDSTLGSLEPGKQANFVVWDGDPLEVTSFAMQVYAAGKAIPMISRQTLLRDRYLKNR